MSAGGDACVEEPGYRFRFSGFADDVDDLVAAVEYLRSRACEPWLLVGHSRGANDVLLAAGAAGACAHGATLFGDAAAGHAAAVDDSVATAFSGIRAVVAIAPRFRMPGMWTRLFPDELRAAVERDGVASWTTPRGVMDVTREDVEIVTRRMDMATVMTRIPPHTPLLLVHGR